MPPWAREQLIQKAVCQRLAPRGAPGLLWSRYRLLGATAHVLDIELAALCKPPLFSRWPAELVAEAAAAPCRRAGAPRMQSRRRRCASEAEREAAACLAAGEQRPR